MEMKDDMMEFKKGFNGGKETDAMATDAAKESAPAVVIAVGGGEPPADGDAPAAAEAAVSEAAPGEPEAEPEADAVVEGEAPAEAALDAEPELSPEEQHKEATWAGRLRKREEELRAREEALAVKGQTPSDPEGDAMDAEAAMDETGEGEGEGDLDDADLDDPEKATARLEADFGDDFVRMLKAAFRGILGDALAELDPKLASRFDAIESGLNNVVTDMTTDHFESLSEAHPDYMDVAADPAFAEYIDALPEEAKVQAQSTIQHGRTRAVIKLLNAFKTAKETQGPAEDDEQPMNDAIDDAALKAAAGVRSNSVAPAITAGQSTDPMEAFRRGFRNAGN